MTADVAAFTRDYTPPLLRHLAHPDEQGLAAAYELGRRSMRAGLGLLTLVRVHDEVLLEVLATARDVEEAVRLSKEASEFLLEALASFEMTQRGFMVEHLSTSPAAPAAGNGPGEG